VQPLSKRDDVQSLAWTLLRLHMGSLPWDGLGLKQAAQVCSMKEQWMNDASAVSSTDTVGKLLWKMAVDSAALGRDAEPDYAGMRKAVEEAWALLGGRGGRATRRGKAGGGLGGEVFLWGDLD
jgi:hypothetical protein